MNDVGCIQVLVKMAKHGEPEFDDDLRLYNVLAVLIKDLAAAAAKERGLPNDKVVVFS